MSLYYLFKVYIYRGVARVEKGRRQKKKRARAARNFFELITYSWWAWSIKAIRKMNEMIIINVTNGE